jgi:hypothetical protein
MMVRIVLLSLAMLLAAAARAADVAPPGSAREEARETGHAAQLLLLLRLPPPHLRAADAYAGNYDDSAARRARQRLARTIAHEHGLRVVGDWPIPLVQEDCYVMEFEAGKGGPEAMSSVLQALARDARVDWAQPLNTYRALGHNDPLFALQPAASAWHLAEIHESVTGRGVRVAVVDSGVELDHPDLAGQVATAANFVDGQPYTAEQHGTAVAGIIGARADNHIGIAGVAPQARLLALRACWQHAGAMPGASETMCSSLTLAKALQFAITSDVQVINMSLSGPQDRLLARLLDAALAHHITVVGAWDGRLADGGFPASHPGVWAISDQRIGRGGALPLVAPGHDVPSTALGAGWRFVDGASYAAAHAAGLFALVHELRALGPGIPADGVVASDASGQIDACATLSHASTACTCNCAVAAAPAAAPAR